MRKRDRFQMFIIVKSIVGKFSNGRVHASLFMQDASETFVALFVESFKERTSAIV